MFDKRPFRSFLRDKQTRCYKFVCIYQGPWERVLSEQNMSLNECMSLMWGRNNHKSIRYSSHPKRKKIRGGLSGCIHQRRLKENNGGASLITTSHKALCAVRIVDRLMSSLKNTGCLLQQLFYFYFIFLWIFQRKKEKRPGSKLPCIPKINPTISAIQAENAVKYLRVRVFVYYPFLHTNEMSWHIMRQIQFTVGVKVTSQMRRHNLMPDNKVK